MTPTERLNQLEKSAVDIMAVFAPWLGPIPSAYLVGTAVSTHLHWHPAVAWIAAIAVELIGVVSVVLALRLYEWNQTKNKTDPGAPFGLALVVVCVYFVVTIGLTVLLDVIPDLARYAPAVFPLLAAVGAVNIALKNGQQRREAAKDEKKKPATVSRGVKRTLPDTAGRTEARTVDGQMPGDFRLLTAEQKDIVASMTSGELAEVAAISDRTARRWKRQVAANGYHK